MKGTTREQVLNRLYELANRLSKNYTYEENNEMWTLCSHWNSEHYDGTGDEAEIFMCEDEDEDGRYRYYIEDDYFYLAD